MINKNLEIKEYKEIDDEIIEIMASDESVDRDNDVIKVDGWNVDNWLKTGSLIYGHDPSSPFNVVGTAHGAEVRDGKLYLYSKLAKKGTSENHDAIRSLIDQKILRGVSVGFKSSDFEANEFGGRNFLKQELLEISLTPIPANSNAHVVKDFTAKTCQDLGITIEDKEVEDTVLEENKGLTEEIAKQDELIVSLLKQLDDQKEKYKQLLENYLSKEEVQDETKDVEPEQTPQISDKAKLFLNLLNGDK